MQYALGLLPICYMLYHRIFRLEESAVWKVLLIELVMRDFTPFPLVEGSCTSLLFATLSTRL